MGFVLDFNNSKEISSKNILKFKDRQTVSNILFKNTSLNGTILCIVQQNVKFTRNRRQKIEKQTTVFAAKTKKKNLKN